MALTDIQVKTAKPKDKAYKLGDDSGLYLFVTVADGKLWRFKYRFDGKEKKLSFGVYPEVSLASARERRDYACKLIASDPPIDPGETHSRQLRMSGCNYPRGLSVTVTHRQMSTLNSSRDVVVDMFRILISWGQALHT